jgi:hypothetical protein
VLYVFLALVRDYSYGRWIGGMVLLLESLMLLKWSSTVLGLLGGDKWRGDKQSVCLMFGSTP